MYEHFSLCYAGHICSLEAKQFLVFARSNSNWYLPIVNFQINLAAKTILHHLVH